MFVKNKKFFWGGGRVYFNRHLKHLYSVRIKAIYNVKIRKHIFEYRSSEKKIVFTNSFLNLENMLISEVRTDKETF